MNAGDDAGLVLTGGLDNLVSLEVNSVSDVASLAVPIPGQLAFLSITNANGEEFASLENVTVTSANDDAELVMTGRLPTQQVQAFSTTAGSATTWNFFVPGVGPVAINSAATASASTVATQLVTAMNANPAFAGYTITSLGNVVTIVNDIAGSADPIEFVSTVGAQGLATVPTITPGVDGAGYEALETVVVDAADDADVTLEDVYGEFTVDVTAGDFAEVTMTNTNATSVTVDADDSEITIGGVEHGNPLLETLTVSGATTDITLEGDLASFSTLDLSGITGSFVVDASDADYGVRDQAEAVTYRIGFAEDPSTFAAEEAQQAREIFKFTGEDIGDITITDFEAASAGATRDYIDFSEFAGVSEFSDLNITASVGNITIEAAGGQFSGTITLAGSALGMGGDELPDLSAFVQF